MLKQTMPDQLSYVMSITITQSSNRAKKRNKVFQLGDPIYNTSVPNSSFIIHENAQPCVCGK